MCAPDQCSESPGICQVAMKGLCINASGGPNTNWAAPSGSNGNIGYCDTYASVTSGVPYTPPGGKATTAAADFISSAVSSYFSNGGLPTDNTYFASKIPGMCAQYPGLCDSILSGVCSTLTQADLNPANWSGRNYDPQGVLPMQMCGCFLPTSQYSSNFPIECQSSCSFPGVIPIGSGNSQAPSKQCTATQCVIDDVTATYMATTGGAISIKQVCGQCTPSDPCACYFSGISVSGVNDPNIQTNCTTCYNYDATSGLSAQVPCPGAGSSGSTTGKKIFYIGLGIVAFLLGVFLFWKITGRNFSK